MTAHSFDADAPCHSPEMIAAERKQRRDGAELEKHRHALSWLERSLPRGVELVAAALAGIEPGECPALLEILANKIRAGGTDLCPVCRKRPTAPGMAHGWCIECSADESSKSPAERVRDRARKEARFLLSVIEQDLRGVPEDRLDLSDHPDWPRGA